MKKRLLAIFLLSPFAGAEKAAVDGYLFEEKEYEKTELQVSIVIARNKYDFNRLAFDAGIPMYSYVGNTHLEAFSILAPSQNKCTIFIKDPNWKYSPEYIGHELSHCIWGRWHSYLPKPTPPR